MTHIKLISVFTLLGLILLFTLQNSAVVELRFLFWKLAMSRALLVFMILAIGMMIGWLIRGLK